MAPRPPTISAGIALLRDQEGTTQVFLVHPGGPFWKNKDTNGWSIPKGEVDPEDDDHAAAARREFTEETGHLAPTGPMIPLPELKLSSSKRLVAFAVNGDLDPDTIVSNHFEMEWPPRSGQTQSFPEIDKGAWFTLDQAVDKLHKGQVPLIEHLREIREPS
ncbi:MAG: NUDIX domain-containing protein [Actinomycetia bacterium]|nr:NUDIX domain-containing protein [Actinomycetes bacterium]MCP5030732.1 NUDIX domain-containing protein [Actinomycetes bacterium]